MFSFINILAAFIGSSIAGYYDLKTTEIPDLIPYSMIALALIIKALNSYFSADVWIIIDSLIVGLSFFAFGLLLYLAGQWGGGDAKVLAAIGFLIPTLPSLYFSPKLLFIFPLSFLLNLFLIGSIYIIIYAFAIAFQNKEVTSAFLKDIKGNFRNLFLIFSITASIIISIPLILAFSFKFSVTHFLPLSFLPSVFGLLVLWRFLRVVEDVGFKKKIQTENLEEGDMLEEEIKDLGLDSKLIKGLTKEEVEKIRENKDEVAIREGVRFAPVFPMALIFTLYFGDFLALLAI